MLKSLLRPSFLIPFSLVTPYLFIGDRGITFLELIILYGFFLHILKNKSIVQHRIINYYSILLISGYFLAIINGSINYDIPLKFSDFKIIYWLIISYAGFYIGYHKYDNINDIVNSIYFKIIIIFLALIVGGYPFLSDEMKYILMRSYWPPLADDNTLGLIYSRRFPGLGMNVNVWAFMNLILLLMALNSAILKRISWIYVFLIMVVLIGAASKTVLGIALLSIIFQLIILKSSILNKIKKIAILTFLIIILILLYFYTEFGNFLKEHILVLKRFSYLIDFQNTNQINPLDDRFGLWSLGLERVQLAPFFGISRPPTASDSYLLYFSHPHNEFIAYWMFMGFIGLLSLIYLICGLIIKNLNSKNFFLWTNIYLALVAQMFFDSAFQTTRFLPLIFIIIGINIRELNNLKIKPGNYNF
jgi:hypothetical protein